MQSGSFCSSDSQPGLALTGTGADTLVSGIREGKLKSYLGEGQEVTERFI